MSSADNPIRNSPYGEPTRHYATAAQGKLNYRDIRPGRRVFTPDVPQVPVGQQEAVEAAVWLNEVAEKSKTGTHLQNQLRQRQATARDDAANHLPRIAFKMATGSGP
jgi:type III restriction enzyme